MKMNEILLASPPPPALSTPPPTAAKCCKSIDFYRNMIQSYIDRHDYESAMFWSDKLVSMSSGSQQDVYTLTKCMYLCGQYHRAANLLFHYQYERSNLHFRCLAAKCLYQAKEYQKALEILDLDNKNVPPGQKLRASVWEPVDSHKSIMGQLHLVRGKIYEALMNRILAAQSYKEALTNDIYCFEAFELLTQHQMLSRAEELTLLQSLPFTKSCLNGDVEFVKYLYASKIKKYPTVEETMSASTVFSSLKKNLDILTGDAERLFYNCDFQMAYKISSQVISEDPYHVNCLPVYIACLVEMAKITELFRIAHKLVEVMSDSALAWYAVGAYYFLIGKQDHARRHLNKALSLHPVFGPAWLLFGHSFASENEHDQAMAAYFKATQLMKGCHLPMLHVGMECGLSNNPQLAMKFLEESRLLAPKDPFIRHEMGVVKFNEKKYEEAYGFFTETLALLEKPNHSISFKKWEPLYNNLGHVLRKLQRYEEAYQFHQKALVLCPSNASTHSAIGLIHAIAGRTEAAIESFHKALSIKRDDACSNSMLRYCIEKLVEESNADDEDVLLIAEDVSEDEQEEGILLRSRSVKTRSTDASAARNFETPEGLADHKMKSKVDASPQELGTIPKHLQWFTKTATRLDSSGRSSDESLFHSTPAPTSLVASSIGVLSTGRSVFDSGDGELRIRRGRTRRELRTPLALAGGTGDRTTNNTTTSSDEEVDSIYNN